MKLVRRIILAMLICGIVTTSTVAPTMAVATSTSYKSGYKKGAAIRKTYKKLSRTKTYLFSKDVFVSEKVILNKKVKNIGNWCATEDTASLKVDQSTSIKVTGDAKLAKSLGLKAEISTSKTVGATFKVNSNKGDYCRLALKCDYLQVTYKQYIYHTNGKQKSCTTKTLLTPIPNSYVYYVQYSN